MGRKTHLVGLLSSLALAVLPLWADSSVPLDARIAGTIATALTLVFSVSKVRHWSHAILGILALGTAITAVVVGKLGAGSTGAFAGGIVLAVLTNLRTIFAKQAMDADATPIIERKPDGGSVRLVALALIAAGFTVALLLMPALARAEAPQAIGCFDAANSYCLVPATALGLQVNLKTGSVRNGALLAGLTLQHEFGTLPLGLGVYGGLGVSSDNASSYQACVGLSITNWGMACIGAQRAAFAGGATAWQGMVTFAGQLTMGGTPSYVRGAR